MFLLQPLLHCRLGLKSPTSEVWLKIQYLMVWDKSWLLYWSFSFSQMDKTWAKHAFCVSSTMVDQCTCLWNWEVYWGMKRPCTIWLVARAMQDWSAVCCVQTSTTPGTPEEFQTRILPKGPSITLALNPTGLKELQLTSCKLSWSGCKVQHQLS